MHSGCSSAPQRQSRVSSGERKDITTLDHCIADADADKDGYGDGDEDASEPSEPMCLFWIDCIWNHITGSRTSFEDDDSVNVLSILASRFDPPDSPNKLGRLQYATQISKGQWYRAHQDAEVLIIPNFVSCNLNWKSDSDIFNLSLIREHP